ncbi:hypothetical protein HBJ11_04025 [Escherichia coli]|nr:hypothetical protein [Escherichia coli]
MACSAYEFIDRIAVRYFTSLMWWGGLLYWLAALVALLWVTSQIRALKRLQTCAIRQTLKNKLYAQQ